MKRRDLVRHLETHGCELHREGSRHSVYVNAHLARKICRDLEVPPAG